MKIIRIPLLETKNSINSIEISYDNLFLAFEGAENAIWVYKYQDFKKILEFESPKKTQIIDKEEEEKNQENEPTTKLRRQYWFNDPLNLQKIVLQEHHNSISALLFLHTDSHVMFSSGFDKYRDINAQPTRWVCKCTKCGNVKSVLGSSLKNGSSKSDGCSRRNESLEGFKIGHWLIGERAQRLRPNGHHCTIYLCLCDCGVQRYVDENRLLSGKSLSCGCVKSRANEKITKWLVSKRVSFKTEFSYPDLIGPGGGLLRFDFALLKNDDSVECLIEYQGEQHYSNTDFGREQREITDPLKRKYCKENHIQLFEIKYTDDIEQELINILSYTLHANPVPSSTNN